MNGGYLCDRGLEAGCYGVVVSYIFQQVMLQVVSHPHS